MSKLGRKILQCFPYCLVKDKFAIKEDVSRIGAVASDAPRMFNEHGEEIKVFYLKDSANVHTPYSLSSTRYPRRILWDRFNVSLKTHFYVHEEIFTGNYPCDRKMAILRESEATMTHLYDGAMNNPVLMSEFDMIFTNSERILNRYENARFAPAGYVWYATGRDGGELSEKNIDRKEKNISIVSSDKSMCEMHVVRAELARHYKGSDKVDAYGNAVGNYLPQKADSLTPYRYSIALENAQTPYYFTEKILDCFASMTVPIYYGATKIDEYFNPDGILQISRSQLDDFSEIDKLIEACDEKDYESRRDAILDNYNRVMDYLCFEDYLDTHYDL